jgi:gluconokinase
MIVVVMGVAGAGKTVVGSALAARLGWPFFDADDFHSPENVAKMAAGIPLTDADREPWLAALHALVARQAAANVDSVLACSALRATFRRRLAGAAPNVVSVYLRVTPAVAQARVANRSGHYMKAALVPTQFEALEPPDDAITIDGSAAVDEIVDTIVAHIAR